MIETTTFQSCFCIKCHKGGLQNAIHKACSHHLHGMLKAELRYLTPLWDTWIDEQNTFPVNSELLHSGSLVDLFVFNMMRSHWPWRNRADHTEAHLLDHHCHFTWFEWVLAAFLLGAAAPGMLLHLCWGREMSGRKIRPGLWWTLTKKCSNEAHSKLSQIICQNLHLLRGVSLDMKPMPIKANKVSSGACWSSEPSHF